MAQYKQLTPETLSRRIKSGRGRGEGKSYKPINTVRDIVPSGTAHATRFPGITVERSHHIFGELQKKYLFVLEWSKAVVDVRESYVLDMESTLDIANRIGLRHPFDPKTKEPIALVTGFLLTIEKPDVSRVDVARCVTFENGLTEKRLRELEIERVYWEERNIDWGIVTERTIDDVLVDNIRWVIVAQDIRDKPKLTRETVMKVEPSLFKFLSNCKSGLADAGLVYDDQVGWDPGTTLWLVRHLIWKRVWDVDMYSKIDTQKPLKILSRNIFEYV